jgi:hypothetical protein
MRGLVLLPRKMPRKVSVIGAPCLRGLDRPNSGEGSILLPTLPTAVSLPALLLDVPLPSPLRLLFGLRLALRVVTNTVVSSALVRELNLLRSLAKR